jgi:thiamine biosynthesis lipoprotein
MSELNRRRFLTITAAACGLASTGSIARSSTITTWRGNALGAVASIQLRHYNADVIIKAARAEIERLEDIFSLYKESSVLSRLNANGHLEQPPFEMLELMSLCQSLNRATAGKFDPTIQPLWALYAKEYSAGGTPADEQIVETLDLVGWRHVRIDQNTIRFAKPGMALTLNGIAQGYIADKITVLLHNQGLRDILVETGELRAIGGHPDGGGWLVTLAKVSDDVASQTLELKDMALATSAAGGTVFDRDGKVGHILNPVTGQPAPMQWSRVSVLAPAAALADGLSTAMCMMSATEIDSVAKLYPGIQVILA